MTDRRLAVMAMMAFGLFVVTEAGVVSGQSRYPWMYHSSSIQCSFADGNGNLMVATGYWEAQEWPQGTFYCYREGGLYRIDGDVVETIRVPENIYVWDGTTDARGISWITFSEAGSWWDYGDRTGSLDATPTLGGQIGYRRIRYPSAPGALFHGALGATRLGRIDGPNLLEWSGFTDLIPGQALMMRSSPRGQVFVVSEAIDGNETTESFVSWWTDTPTDCHTVTLSDPFQTRAVPRDYPQFGQDGFAYLLCTYSRADRWQYGVLCLNPETEQCDVYGAPDSPFLDSMITFVYVDALNLRWFGTEDGLVRFDGENWTRLTTEDNKLPYNYIIQMLYDEIDAAYYVTSKSDSGSHAALTVLSASTGEPIGDSFVMPSIGDSPYRTELYRGAMDTFWLAPNKADVAYSYDHDRVGCWNIHDWVDLPYVLYIGSYSPARMYCVFGEGAEHMRCIMIW